MNRSQLSALIVAVCGTLSTQTAFAVSGAELIRDASYRYGKYEARIQFAPGDGVVSTFFLWKNGSEMEDVYWNEIDIEKLGADCTGYSSNALYGLPQANHTQEIDAGVDLCAGYHTHAIEWTPDYLIWLLDGQEVRRLTGADLAAFEDNAPEGMQMRFNLWVGNASFGGNFSPDILPVHQYINWVRYSEYTPGAGDDGTDFTVSLEEHFDAPLAAGWSYGTWASPFNLSTHSPSNVTIVDGKAVLSLTADDAVGFSGTPPSDPEFDGGSGSGGSGGSAATGGSTSTGSGGTASGGTASGGVTQAGGSTGETGGGTGAPASDGGSSSGCQLSTVPARGLTGLAALAAALLCFAGRRRRSESA